MIQINHLVKKYGDTTAVDDLSLTLEPGKIYGFLGPNGAGKSTTMNIITGYIAATSGEVLINGHDISKEPVAAKKCIGYLPEIPPLYVDMRVKEYLEFVAELKGISKDKQVEEIERVSQLSGVKDVEGKLIRNLSKGYKQRVGLAQAVMGFPDTIILDEPTVGLDPRQIIEMRQLIRSLAKEHTVILSSHILSEISEVCDHVFIISKGKLVASDSMEELERQMNGAQTVELLLQSAPNIEEKIQLLDHIDFLREISTQADQEAGDRRFEVNAVEGADIRAELYRCCVNEDAVILEMRATSKSLEEVFMELTQGGESDESNL